MTCIDCGVTVYRTSTRCRACAVTHTRLALEVTFPDRFWAKVDRRGPDECWPWQERSRQKRGYGCIGYPGLGRPVGAHRVALELYIGRRLRPGEYACHHCDNPPCCNPAHLFVGTQMDNLADMKAKGRSLAGSDRHPSRSHPERIPRGSAHFRAKLTEEDIPVIRRRIADGEYHRVIAAEYGVGTGAISKVANGSRWRHVA